MNYGGDDDNPMTADLSNPLLWAATAFISLACFVTILLFRSKSDKFFIKRRI